MEAFALPEGDPVYEVAVRGSGWQKEVQEIRAVATPASGQTAIQVWVSHDGGFIIGGVWFSTVGSFSVPVRCHLTWRVVNQTSTRWRRR